jgi:nicotine blue oxidoreductase
MAPERFRVAGLVLAAGAGTRFGGPKQLAQFRGAPLIEWPLRALAAATLDDVVVVLGAHADAVIAGADLTGATVVRCAAWEQGQAASLRAGLEAAGSADAVVVVLGDQPLLHAEAVRRVVAAGRAGGAVRASYANVPGHPTLIPRSLWPELGRLEGDTGAAALLRASGYRSVICDDLGDPVDVDTPEALARLEAAS